MIHQHWCKIRGHWFDATCEHDEDYVGTKEDSENGHPVELRSDCPDCAGFHFWKIPRGLGYFWRYWICSRLTGFICQSHQSRRLRCLGCGKPITDQLASLYSMFHMVDHYVCYGCQHFPKPECGPDCKFCKTVDEDDPCQ